AREFITRIASPSAPENVRLQPEPFSGDVEACGGFLLQCQLISQQAPRHYQTDHSKITLIINSLCSKALQWAQAFLTANPINNLSYDRFLSEFRGWINPEEMLFMSVEDLEDTSRLTVVSPIHI
uniref:DUF4939 domain-containing protein n=1 Tax=Oryzias melastigma TaxID=30732 RepID=A0A3B3BTV8_ORYME